MRSLCKCFIGILAAASLVLPPPVWAQDERQSPAPQSATGSALRSSSEQMSAEDRRFLHEAALADLADIALGPLALQASASPSVRQFAERMIGDHRQTHLQLEDVAQAKRIALPEAADTKQQQVIQRLQKLSASQFDEAYMKRMVEAHQQDIRMFRREIAQGSDADIKSFAASTLPKIHDHLAMAQEAFKTAKAADRSHKSPATLAGESRRSQDKATGANADDTAATPAAELAPGTALRQ
jgi:putative membrane protein